MGKDRYQEPTIVLPSSRVQGKIGIVTVTYNSALVLSDFLTSLAEQSYANFSLIVVDNASTDNTLEILGHYQDDRLTVITNELNAGVAAANNQGIRAAIVSGCEYVLLLNNDVVFGATLIGDLVQGLAEHSCSMTVPMMYFHEPQNRIWAAGGGFQPWLGFRSYHRFEGENDLGQYQSCRIDYTPTCCVLIRSEVFEAIGIMDERYFVYSDDVDFMFRARQAGIVMFFVSNAKLWHKVNSLTGGATSEFGLYYTARGRALFLFKHLSKWQAYLWTSVHLAFDVIRAWIWRDFRSACAVKQKGMRDGRQVAIAF